MKIRKATAEDIPSLMGLAAESATAAHWTEQQYRDLISPAEKVRRLAIVAEGPPVSDPATSAKGLLGFLIARLQTPECELENIAVSHSQQRKGIGRQLLNALKLAASQTNCEVVFLEVRESNQAARAFYESVGFKANGRRKSYYSNPSEDAILYYLAVH
ncbi:MAG TPA: ribosomal protein S18-alanine N-acetyltransferase [Candidatus Binatia bacterium]|nr:ribosomal protein S18-alanine N-acetyltransferase [Candidatus Binatia bacterium]